jgi:hypothetical protein
MHRDTALLLLVLAACSSPRGDTPRDSATSDSTLTAPAGATSDTGDARARIARLESEARALATLTGCTSADECRTAPVGSRGCGGPRTFIAYCAASTDTVALFRKLDELKAAEEKYNAANGIGSTCEMRMPPVPGFTGGRCTAP